MQAGTTIYMAPEQLLLGKFYDEKVDIWALAVCFLELCYGADEWVPPFL